MKRYSNKQGMMIENPRGGWVKHEDVFGICDCTVPIFEGNGSRECNSCNRPIKL